MGAYCEAAVGWMQCPVQCDCMYGEIRCENRVGDLECPSFTCIPDPAAMAIVQDPWTCPALCPAQCDPMTEQPCPGPKLTRSGCLGQETCIPLGEQCPYDWDGCPVVEEQECGGNKFNCDFDYDIMGCRVPGSDVCVKKRKKCPATSYDSQGCPVLTETECPDGQIKCEDMLGSYYDTFVR